MDSDCTNGAIIPSHVGKVLLGFNRFEASHGNESLSSSSLVHEEDSLLLKLLQKGDLCNSKLVGVDSPGAGINVGVHINSRKNHIAKCRGLSPHWSLPPRRGMTTDSVRLAHIKRLPAVCETVTLS